MQNVLIARRLVGLVLVGLVAAWPACADTSKPVRARATIDQVSGDSISVISRSGEKIIVTLTANTMVVAVVPTRLEDIVSGSFIGSAAMPRRSAHASARKIRRAWMSI